MYASQRSPAVPKASASKPAVPKLLFTLLGQTVLLAALVACGSKPPPVAPKAEGEETKSSSSGVSVPGECVDPVADGDQHDPTRPADKHVQLDVRDIDLDGDGVIDTFVKPAWSCGHGCNRSAYVVRSTCGHYVGTFPSEDRYEALDEKTNGLRDIKAHPRRSDGAALRCYQLILKFDGKQYQGTRHRECECKDESPKCEGDWTDGDGWQPE